MMKNVTHGYSRYLGCAAGNCSIPLLDINNITSNNNTLPDDTQCSVDATMLSHAIVRSFFGVSALTGNLLILLSVLVYRHMRTVDNMLICNLSVSNCLTCFYVLFDAIHFLKTGLPFRKRLNDIKICLYLLFQISSVYNLVLMSLERVISLLAPLRYKTIVTKSKALRIIFIFWIVYVSYVTFPLYTDGEYLFTNEDTMGSQLSVFHKITYAVFAVGTTTNVILFMVIMVILFRARRRSVQVGGRRHGGKQRMKTITVLTMLISTVISWSPVLFLTIMYAADWTVYLMCFKVSTKTFALVNASFNWIIYGIMRTSFRKSFLRLIKCNYQQKTYKDQNSASRSVQ